MQSLEPAEVTSSEVANFVFSSVYCLAAAHRGLTYVLLFQCWWQNFLSSFHVWLCFVIMQQQARHLIPQNSCKNDNSKVVFTGNPQYSVFGDEMICLSDFFNGWLSLLVIVALQLILITEKRLRQL